MRTNIDSCFKEVHVLMINFAYVNCIEGHTVRFLMINLDLEFVLNPLNAISKI